MIQSSLHAASAYRSVGLQTKAAGHDPYQLVVLMYETVLDDINKARGAVRQSDLALKIKHIDRAIRIIQEGLRTSLDLDNGGELAANLQALYDYAVVRLVQANAQNDESALAEVVALIEPLLDAWRQIGPNSQSNATLAASTPARSAAAEPVASAQPVPHTQRRPVPAGAYASVAAYAKTAATAGV